MRARGTECWRLNILKEGSPAAQVRCRGGASIRCDGAAVFEAEGGQQRVGEIAAASFSKPRQYPA